MAQTILTCGGFKRGVSYLVLKEKQAFKAQLKVGQRTYEQECYSMEDGHHWITEKIKELRLDEDPRII